jgi:hypothetical protein
MTRKFIRSYLVLPRAESTISTIRVLAHLREAFVSLSRKTNMIKYLTAAGAFVLLIATPACTDLTEVPQSAISPDNFYRNEDEVIGGLASVYAQLRSTTDDAYNISEISTDEMVVPTRGSDWFDGGKWLDIHRQTYAPNSPAGINDINGAWVNMFQGVARANVVLDALGNVSFAGKATVIAELRTLRAFYYYLLMDLFGGVPIVCADAGNAACKGDAIETRTQNTRAEVFAFIQSELTAAKADLPVSWPQDMNGRLTKGAADAILADMYLNAEVFTGTVSATGLAKGPSKWNEAIASANNVLAGPYTLSTNANAGCATPGCGWRKNFTADNNTSPEIIMAVKFVDVSGLGLNFLMRALHYNQYTPSPWNGFSTLAETFFAFDPNDIRRQIFLAGPQFNVETGQPAKDRAGNPLVFDPNIANVTAATEGEGVRITKWPSDPAHVNQDNGNDYAHYRLAEIYLIKAEAMNELGQTAAAIQLINTTTRARAFETTPKPLPAGLSQVALRDSILSERLFELTAEGKRRTDLIRIGAEQGGVNKFNQLWSFKPAVSPAYKILFPIPQNQIETNPLLKQNPGY